MPDFWSHIIGGELLQREAEESWRRMVKTNRTAFNFGCQGPDFFFYNDFWPWISKRRGPEAGRKIQQEKTTALFSTAAGYLKENYSGVQFPLLAAYFTGFLSHYLLDRWLHPFIRSRVDNLPLEHKNLEILLDCYLVKKYRGQAAWQLDPAAAIDFAEGLPPLIGGFYRKILHDVYQYPQDIDFIEDSYRDMKRLLGIFHRPGRVKKGAFLLLNRVLRQNVSALFYPQEPEFNFLNHYDWQEVDSRLEEGITEGRQLLKKVGDFLKGRIGRPALTAAFPGINFDGDRID